MIRLRETLTDQKEKNEQLAEQVKIFNSENNFLKKNYERQANKLKKLQENNILIPKLKDSATENLNESVIKDEESLLTRLQ